MAFYTAPSLWKLFKHGSSFFVLCSLGSLSSPTSLPSHSFGVLFYHCYAWWRSWFDNLSVAVTVYDPVLTCSLVWLDLIYFSPFPWIMKLVCIGRIFPLEFMLVFHLPLLSPSSLGFSTSDQLHSSTVVKFLSSYKSAGSLYCVFSRLLSSLPSRSRCDRHAECALGWYRIPLCYQLQSLS